MSTRYTMSTTAADVPERLLVDFDIHDPSIAGQLDTVQDRLRELAAIGPVLYSTAHGGHWLVVGYDEAHEVLRGPDRFSSYPNNIVQQGTDRFVPLEFDPPEHTYYRQALQPLFSPRRMKALEPRIREVTGELIDSFAGRGECEYISEFAHELPTRMFLALMGWPLADAPMFTECVDTVLMGKPGVSDEESDAAKAEAGQRLFGYFAQVVADRRSRPEVDDDVSAAVINQILDFGGEQRKLTDDELYRMFFLLMIAGLHTVQASLAWAVINLSARPEVRRRLVDDPSAIPGAVEEILRFEAAVTMGRSVVADTELGGVRLRAGDQLLVFLAAANRDPAEFADPSELEIDRTPNRHLAFGSGPHRCLGSHLARIELRIALEEIHRRIPDYRLDPDDPPISHASQVRGVARLPIRFTPEGS